MKTVEQLEDELESLWTDFEELQRWGGDTMDELIAARKKNEELERIIAMFLARDGRVTGHEVELRQ
jgi:hypothetical protein